MTASPVRLGGCLCGAVRYAVADVRTAGTLCHCSQCRRASGAPMVAWFSAALSSFALTTGVVGSFRASDHATRSFCSGCGTALFFQEDGADEIDITTCSLDVPDDVPPRDHTFVENGIAWNRPADSLPCFARTRSESVRWEDTHHGTPEVPRQDGGLSG